MTELGSGDLVADRRAAYAEALARSGDLAAAAELMAQALEIAPGWVAGRSLYARYLADSGARAAAIAEWQLVADTDSAGIFGAKLALAALGAAEPEPDPRYVAALFDDYAPRFETALRDKLRYRTPEALVEALQATGFSGAMRTLDLGCGTGLMGVALGGLAGTLEGVDLSGRMLAEARAKGIYARLVEDNLLAFLGAEETPADLIVAADVLNYLGPLGPVFAAVRPKLAQGGRFAFSLEAHDGAEELVVGDSLRFRHNGAAARALAHQAGFRVLHFAETVLREDRGVPVRGALVVLG